MSDKKMNDQAPNTTGHSWDGIEEFDNPLPRWWLWTFYASILFAIVWTILYPAWPISTKGATPGLLGYSSRAAVAADIERYKKANAAVDKKLTSVPVDQIEKDPELLNYALNGGAAVFRTWCAQCHGAGASGAKGYPNLIDDDWLWGGTIDDIYTTVSHGIRFASDEDTRDSEMPVWGDQLSEQEIADVVQYVRSISGQKADAKMAEAGASVFADNCAACHGDDGKGNRDVGAPNLTDQIWLYGGDVKTLTQTVTRGRHGVMPAWAGRLTESQIRQVAVWVHQQGGGE